MRSGGQISLEMRWPDGADTEALDAVVRAAGHVIGHSSECHPRHHTIAGMKPIHIRSAGHRAPKDGNLVTERVVERCRWELPPIAVHQLELW